ncbi:hypothetical protein [Epilithonimonas mollis]|uniref:Uncharacterized protein n=1 Tax=Epilithonimonas mollis TaxID=216903 RepID=A0A1M6UQY2_9FLAO|nr:hypothetical protein [Epilithonimonas mollis]SHK71580.1 hypothetical protein SAMN05444371_3425 [Epilithonimonas mollis]
MREISILKEKILQYIEYKGVTKYEFYKNTGVSNGVLSQKSGLSEENLLRFLSYYKDVNLDWLFSDKGPMLKEHKKGSISQNITGDGNTQSGYGSIITGDNKKLVKELQKKLDKCEGELKEKDKTISQLVNLMSSK